MTRFRGMINTQPGSVPLASFKVMSFEEVNQPACYPAGNDIGMRDHICHTQSFSSIYWIFKKTFCPQNVLSYA